MRSSPARASSSRGSRVSRSALRFPNGPRLSSSKIGWCGPIWAAGRTRRNAADFEGRYATWCIKVYEMPMSRTNVVIDETLVRRVMRLYRLPTKRAAIDFALRALVGDRRRRDMLDLEGAGWDGDLVRMRMTRVPKI